MHVLSDDEVSVLASLDYVCSKRLCKESLVSVIECSERCIEPLTFHADTVIDYHSVGINPHEILRQ